MLSRRWLYALAVGAVSTQLMGVGTAAAGPVTNLRFAGRIAMAGWTTCPNPSPGQHCTDTDLIASESSLKEKGFGRSAGPRLIFRQFDYVVVDFGGGDVGFRSTRETIGGTDDATVSIRPRLERAEATAVVPVDVCTFRADGDTTCRPDTVAVHAEWTAAGDIERLDERSVNHAPGVLFKAYTKGWQRVATASATLDGAPVPGVLTPGLPPLLVSARQGEMTVCHGGC